MARIAIVEDDQLIAQMYRLKFEDEGFVVDVAEDGRAGLAVILNSKPDLILLDLTLPEMDGQTVLKTIREQPEFAATPVLILTNLDAPKMPAELAQYGITDYIIKADETPREIIAKVKKTLGLEE